jgi:hypothetical protein
MARIKKTSAPVPGVPTESRKGATAKGERSGPVSMVEAQERLQPHFGDVFKMADWLNDRHRLGDIPLFGDGIEMPPAANQNGQIVIVGHSTPSGKAFLEVQASAWTPRWTRSREELEWAFERERFERHFPGGPKNRGGRPREFNVEDLLAEALVYTAVAGALPKTVEGEGSLHEKLLLRLGSRCPGRVRFGEIFGPIYQRIKDERPADPRRLIKDEQSR